MASALGSIMEWHDKLKAGTQLSFQLGFAEHFCLTGQLGVLLGDMNTIFQSIESETPSSTVMFRVKTYLGRWEPVGRKNRSHHHRL